MSIEKTLQKVELLASGYPGTVAGEVAHGAVQDALAKWRSQLSHANEPTSLVSVTNDFTELLKHLSKIQNSLQETLHAANQSYLNAALSGTADDLDIARDAGADLENLGSEPLDLALGRTDSDYSVVRKILEHTYGDTNLPTFDGMSALGHTVRECAAQIKEMAVTKIVVEQGIELPDLFKF